MSHVDLFPEYFIRLAPATKRHWLRNGTGYETALATKRHRLRSSTDLFSYESSTDLFSYESSINLFGNEEAAAPICFATKASTNRLYLQPQKQKNHSAIAGLFVCSGLCTVQRPTTPPHRVYSGLLNQCVFYIEHEWVGKGVIFRRWGEMGMYMYRYS